MTTFTEEQKYWDDGASTYDSAGYTDEVVELLSTELKAGNTLEIGSGKGRLSHELGKVSKFNVFGIDISSKMISYSPRDNVKYSVSDGRTIPYPDNYFSNIYSVTVFQHLPPPAKISYIEESARTLAVGGYLLIQFVVGDTHNDFDHNISALEMTELIEDKGLKVRASLNLVHPLWHWIKAVKK